MRMCPRCYQVVCKCHPKVGLYPPRPLKWYPLGWFSVHKLRYVTWQVDDFGMAFVVNRSTLLHFINYT